MGNWIKRAAYTFSAALLCGLVLVSSVVSQHQRHVAPSVEEIKHMSNNSNVLLVKQQSRVIEKSRRSAVQVISISEDHQVAMQSGTYVTFLGRYFVLTTAHGILGDCPRTRIYIGEMEEFVECGRFIEIDRMTDYALIEITSIESRSPIRIPKEMPSNIRQWEKELAVMNRIFYTGYPNNTGPLTISGHNAGYSHEDYLYAISYAWSGSSGAGVFSQQGHYIGYVLAIDVGDGVIGMPTALENVVLIVPIFKVNWESAFGLPPMEVPEAEDTAN